MYIAIISVAPPYRGGISQHTSILAQKLSQKHLVKVINYKRQYPRMLFPGKTEYLTSKKILGDRCLDSINPFSWFNVGRKLVASKFDLVIFRIWNPFFSPALGMIALQLRKKSPKTKLISLCDNIVPHEQIPLGNFLTNYVLYKMHGHIVQSTQTEKELNEILDDPVYVKRLHPLYDIFPNKIDKRLAKKQIGINSENIILFFGLIRHYKGFDILLKSISLLKEKQIDFHLLVAGECYESKEKYNKMINEFNISKFITWDERYIPDNEVAKYFSAADVVALPYRSASQSGITQIAYHYDLPVIVTRIGGLPEFVDDGKSGFIINPEDYNELTKVLYKNFSKSKFRKMSKDVQEFKKNFSWDIFINGIEKVYSKL